MFYLCSAVIQFIDTEYNLSLFVIPNNNIVMFLYILEQTILNTCVTLINIDLITHVYTVHHASFQRYMVLQMTIGGLLMTNTCILLKIMKTVLETATMHHSLLIQIHLSSFVGYMLSYTSYICFYILPITHILPYYNYLYLKLYLFSESKIGKPNFTLPNRS